VRHNRLSLQAVITEETCEQIRILMFHDIVGFVDLIAENINGFLFRKL
jgi:hypothetical protein